MQMSLLVSDPHSCQVPRVVLNSKCTCSHVRARGGVALKMVCGQARWGHIATLRQWIAIGQQKPGLKSVLQYSTVIWRAYYQDSNICPHWRAQKISRLCKMAEMCSLILADKMHPYKSNLSKVRAHLAFLRWMGDGVLHVTPRESGRAN